MALQENPEYEAVAGALLNSVKRHTWYLCNNIVMIRILDDDVSEAEKTQLYQKLCSYDFPKIEDIHPKKPEKCPSDFFKSSTSLADFVDQRSWAIFLSLGFNQGDMSWLHFPPDQWAKHVPFQRFENIGRRIVCTNDVAERAIKLVQVKNFFHIYPISHFKGCGHVIDKTSITFSSS